MATKVDIQWEGFQEFDETMDQIKDDFGVKDARNILQASVKQSMQPVLTDAKIRAPVDTGALAASLQLEARKPTNKDRRSKYVERNDAVIAAVTTAPAAKLAKRSFMNVRNYSKYGPMKPHKQTGITSDARAVAMEFGTKNVAARPYLRPALESNSNVVVNSLGESLGEQLNKYKARQAKKLLKG